MPATTPVAGPPPSVLSDDDLRRRLKAADEAYADLLARISRAGMAAEKAIAQAKLASEAAVAAQREITEILAGILEGRPATARCPTCRRLVEPGHLLCDFCELRNELERRLSPSPWNPPPQIPQTPVPWEITPGLYPPTTGGTGGLFPPLSSTCGGTTGRP